MDNLLHKFNFNYFENGIENKISNYKNYIWREKLILERVKHFISELNIRKNMKILDFGCAKGYYVRAFRELGYNAFGIDASEYAYDNSDSSVKDYLTFSLYPEEILKIFKGSRFDIVISKDTLEHIPSDSIKEYLKIFSRISNFLLCIVPITQNKDGKYINHSDNIDITHIIKFTKFGWIKFLSKYGNVQELPTLCKKIKNGLHIGSLCLLTDFRNRQS